MIWKSLYGNTSRDHRTLGYFRSVLNQTSVPNDPKKDVNACVDFLLTVFKGHILACAYTILGVTNLESSLPFPPGIAMSSASDQLQYLRQVAVLRVVEKCTLIDAALTREIVEETTDGVHNYAQVLCHHSALVLEFLDAWAEGDGERVFRSGDCFCHTSMQRIIQIML